MKIFALDSTAKTASVALCEDRVLLAQFTQNGGNTHSETLLPMTEVLLRSMKMNINDIDLFAVSAGPGSFTGVRIGAATIKGLCHSTNKRCVGVSTLKALAYNLLSKEKRYICPVMDARRGQFYTAIFKSQDGVLTRITEDSALSTEELIDAVAQLGEKVFLCGDGYTLARRALGDELCYETAETSRYQSAYSVACVALEEYLSGNSVTADELRPTYLRLPQAERDRLAAIENK
jgi:tRNA threonylcarbamoyladenosine biosynthesis protein TsaB